MSPAKERTEHGLLTPQNRLFWLPPRVTPLLPTRTHCREFPAVRDQIPCHGSFSEHSSDPTVSRVRVIDEVVHVVSCPCAGNWAARIGMAGPRSSAKRRMPSMRTSATHNTYRFLLALLVFPFAEKRAKNTQHPFPSWLALEIELIE